MISTEEKNYQAISRQLKAILEKPKSVVSAGSKPKDLSFLDKLAAITPKIKPKEQVSVKKPFSILATPKPKVVVKPVFVGRPGKDGKNGVDGNDGSDGRNGRDGIDGANGRDGKDGESVSKEMLKEMFLEVLSEMKDEETLMNERSVEKIVKKHLSLTHNKFSQDLATLRGDVMRNYGGHGGTGGTQIKQFDLSALLNGATKSFTIPANTAITGIFSSSAPFIFVPTTDYLGTGTTTLTFTANVDAPSALAAGQTLIVQYS